MTYQGRCLAILRATGEGTITLKAGVDGLEDASVPLRAAR